MNNHMNTTHIPRRNARIANRMIDSMIKTLKTLKVMGMDEASARDSLDNLVALYEDFVIETGIEDEAPHALHTITCTIEDLW